MTDTTTITAELGNVLDSWSSALLPRSRVTDDLLDLRLSMHDDLGAITIIDKALATMPGKNLVTREWANEVLDQLMDRARVASLTG